ncbi:hypothetical protein HYU09_03070 [Candidatus Woesearchaeota archaeon]|nr:hypothetical protein [Candidatus Woesearchaeota archaeon]
MNEAISFLKEWFIRFLQNRDLVRRNIVSIDSNEGPELKVNYRDKAVNFSIVPDLDGSIFEKACNKEDSGFVILNNDQNLKFVHINWKKLAENKSMVLYFINPFSNTDKAWILYPGVHDKICDKSSLETGLKAMAEMVEPINYEKVAERLTPRKQASAQQSR